MQHFDRGAAVSARLRPGIATESGTVIAFRPDPDVFGFARDGGPHVVGFREGVVAAVGAYAGGGRRAATADSGCGSYRIESGAGTAIAAGTENAAGTGAPPTGAWACRRPGHEAEGNDGESRGCGGVALPHVPLVTGFAPPYLCPASPRPSGPTGP